MHLSDIWIEFSIQYLNDWIYFRFSSRFELPLLVQSIVMNVTMFLMIHLCVNVRRNNAILKARERVFTGKHINKQLNKFNFANLTKQKIKSWWRTCWIYVILNKFSLKMIHVTISNSTWHDSENMYKKCTW